MVSRAGRIRVLERLVSGVGKGGDGMTAKQLQKDRQELLDTLKTIYGLIQDQVDETIRGQRSRYDWKGLVLQINEEANSALQNIMTPEERRAYQQECRGEK